MPETFGITMTARLRHAALWAAVKKLGSQAALARHLEVATGEIWRWCNLKGCPPASWSKEKLWAIEQKLFALTGQTLDEIFPTELRQAEEFLRSDKTIERTEKIELQRLASEVNARLTLPCPSEEAEKAEFKVALKQAMKNLTWREKEILKLRFGLDGGLTYDLPSVAHIFKITKERVRQVEAKALRKLEQPMSAAKLAGFLD